MQITRPQAIAVETRVKTTHKVTSRTKIKLRSQVTNPTPHEHDNHNSWKCMSTTWMLKRQNLAIREPNLSYRCYIVNWMDIIYGFFKTRAPKTCKGTEYNSVKCTSNTIPSRFESAGMLQTSYWSNAHKIKHAENMNFKRKWQTKLSGQY